jgi:colicin import membrane protein
MEMKMEHHDSLLKSLPDDGIKGILWATTLAMIAHLLMVALLAYVPRLHSPRQDFQPAIQVDLVSPVLMNSAASLTPQQAPDAAQAVAIPVKKKKGGVGKPNRIKPLAEPVIDTTAQSSSEISVKETAVSSSSLKKHALKKKTYRADRITKIKQEHSSPPEVASRPAEAKTAKESRETVASRQPPAKQANPTVSDDVFEQLRARVEKQVQEQPFVGSGTGGGGQAAAMNPETAYLYRVADDIQRNWVFSRRLAGNQKNLRAVLFFKIMPDGEIRDIVFETRSGNRYLDESAYKAIVKSNPLRPHPPGIHKPVVIAAYGFTPEGME